jgi:hypothetical protein
MFHYVYEISNGNQFYIGCRSSRCRPEEDVKYKGSGVWILFTVAYSKRVKTILSVWATRFEAEEEESRLIRLRWNDRGRMNRKKSSPRRRKDQYV